MDINIIDEFREERTQHRVSPSAVDGHGLSVGIRDAVQSITPGQSVELALMSLPERCAVVRRALELDKASDCPMSPDRREQAERWLGMMARTDQIAQILEGA